jgi:hypothetical protein
MTMARFQTTIKSARFVYSPYTATEMQGFAQVLTDSIRARIGAAVCLSTRSLTAYSSFNSASVQGCSGDWRARF